MKAIRLSIWLVEHGLTATRSQAENYIQLGYVLVNGTPSHDPRTLIRERDKVALKLADQYVSRAALKLASVADLFHLGFVGKAVLDVGSSTGGFTDYALRHGAAKVVAVDVGTNQLHPTLRSDPRIELHEKTDIRDFTSTGPFDLILADVSFISLRDLLPHIAELASQDTAIVAMVKPQFEADSSLLHDGIVKNDRYRRQILGDFEAWARRRFIVVQKADSTIPGAKGNQERFYLLKTSTYYKWT